MSNPIHSTSAKSVLPMLAMRGLATGLCAGCVVGLLRLSRRSGRCACGALAGRVARGMVDGTDLVRRTGCAGRDPQAHRQGGAAHQRLGYSADGVGAGRASFLYMVACIARKIFRELAGVVRRACPWPGRPEHPDGRGRGRGVSCALEAGGSPCPDRKPLCCGRGRGGPCRRLWGTRRRGAVRLRGNEVPAGYLADCGGVCVGHRRAPHDPHCLRHGAHPSVCGVRSASAVLFLDLVALEGAVFGVLGVGYNKTLLWLHDREAGQTLDPRIAGGPCRRCCSPDASRCSRLC